MSGVISRSKIVGKYVYNPDGMYVGTVKDVGFTLEEGRPILIVETGTKAEIEIPWTNIGAVGDIVILKESVEVPAAPAAPVAEPAVAQPVAQPTTAQPTVVEEEKRGFSFRLPRLSLKKELPRCPRCGGELTYIEQYDRWYCYNCQMYV